MATTPQGKRYIDRVSGESFFVRNNGEITTVSDSLACKCGSEFTAYVRQNLDPFPFDPNRRANRDITDLWPGRKLKLQLNNNSNNKSDWRTAEVISFNEWISGPYSPCTIWEMSVKFVDDDSDDAAMLGVATFRIDHLSVNEGGTLKGDVENGQQENIPFEWLDPAVPTLTIADSTCYHGSSEQKYKGEYQDAIAAYLKDFASNPFGKKEKEAEHTSPKVEEFVSKHSELVTEDFCSHLYSWCLQEYLTGGLSGYGAISSEGGHTDSICGLLVLANNLRYRYLPAEPTDRDIPKISRYARFMLSERGVARILAKEVNCPCVEPINEKTKRMAKHQSVCFGCKKELPKAETKDCAKCLFARYCGRDCQVKDWPKHKTTCKAVRNAMKKSQLPEVN